MAWIRPPDLPINRTDATPQQGTHPTDHNNIGAAVNNIGIKVQDHDYYLSTTNADGIGNVGKVIYGSTPAGDIGPGTEKAIASIVLTAGTWVVYYSVLLAASNSFNASLKTFGTTAGVRVRQYSVPLIGGGGAYLSLDVTDVCNGAGTVSYNVGNSVGAGPIATYADPTNHRLFAVGVKTT